MAIISSRPAKDTPATLTTSVSIAFSLNLLVEHPKGFHHIIKTDGKFAWAGVTQSRRGIDGARVRGP